jgi:hypothetical protein
MSGEFNWWLLIVGAVAGVAITWLVLADSRRREDEVTDEELSAEAGWIARTLPGGLERDDVERVLRAHHRYLGFAPPDTLVDPAELVALERAQAAAVAAAGAAASPGGAPPAPATSSESAPSSKP